MLNKLKKFIFAEEEDEYEQYEEEVQYEEAIVEASKFKQFVEEAPTLKTKVEHTPTMGKINVDIHVEEAMEEVPVAVEEKSVRQKIIVRKEEFQMQPVISLIKGSNKSSNSESSSDAPYIAPIKKETFNNVISPIYGVKEVQPILHDKKKQEAETFKFSNIEDIIDANDDVDNIPLDEIVSKVEITSEDLIQCSLFGEEKVIIEEIFENDKVTEVSDDSLPF